MYFYTPKLPYIKHNRYTYNETEIYEMKQSYIKRHLYMIYSKRNIK